MIAAPTLSLTGAWGNAPADQQQPSPSKSAAAMNTSTSEREPIAAINAVIRRLEQIRERVALAGAALDGWELSYSGVLPDLVQFCRRFDAETRSLDFTLDPKPLARALGKKWNRVGDKWEGDLDGVAGCKVIIHHAETQQPPAEVVHL